MNSHFKQKLPKLDNQISLTLLLKTSLIAKKMSLSQFGKIKSRAAYTGISQNNVVYQKDYSHVKVFCSLSYTNYSKVRYQFNLFPMTKCS